MVHFTTIVLVLLSLCFCATYGWLSFEQKAFEDEMSAEFRNCQFKCKYYSFCLLLKDNSADCSTDGCNCNYYAFLSMA